MKLPETPMPIQEIPYHDKVRLFIKREDHIHPEISGNKYWKLFYNINNYLEQKVSEALVITFGGAYSNHIAATAALGREAGIKTLGIIRGEELAAKISENPTLRYAERQGMSFRFVTREGYRDKEMLRDNLQKEFPQALIIPEGGSNTLAVKGIQHMLDSRTHEFDYLCTAVGTGGTMAGLVSHAQPWQTVVGIKVLEDPSLESQIESWAPRKDFQLVESKFGRYGKITDENVDFINNFYQRFQIPLDPIYTGKMMQQLCELIDAGEFPEGSRILAFHNGGLQGINGANHLLRSKARAEVKVWSQ